MSSRSPELALQSQFIRAGAGAGKTTKLISSFLDFATEFKNKHQRLPRIIMTTFTRKATQEVKERLLVAAFEIEKQKKHKELFEYINQKSYVHISTIHGVLSLLLNQQSDQMRFPQDIKVIDDLQYSRILKKQMNTVLKKQPEFIELLDTYSFSELVDITKSALDFKAQNKKLSYINKDELKSLADKRINKIILTIDAILNEVSNSTEAWAKYFEYYKQLKTNLESQNFELFFLTLEHKPKKPTWKPAKPDFDPSIHEEIVELNDVKLKNLFDTSDYIEQHEFLNSLFDRYLQVIYELQSDQKKQTGLLTISDLESLSLKLIEEHPEAVREFSDSWDYFMIDEYQDTSPLQVKILNQIISNKPCFVVGDPQQSIYLFRGARSEVFDQKQIEMQKNNARIDILDRNYRSEPNLMSHINQIVTELSTTQFKPMQLKVSQVSTKNHTHDVCYIQTDETAMGTLQHVQNLLKAGAVPKDICILSKNNKTLLPIALLATKHQVAVQMQSAKGFEGKREILDLMSFNRFLNNPHDDDNFITLVRSPWLYLSDEQILELAVIRQNFKSSYWTALSHSSFAQKMTALNYLNLFDHKGSLQTTKLFIHETGFLNYSLCYDPTGRREANTFKYLTALADAEAKPGFSLGLFLDEQFLSLQSDLGSGQGEAQPVEQPDCVTLMTVHAAKGLQFKHVVVVGFNDLIQTTKTLKIYFQPEQQKYSLSCFDIQSQKIEASDWSRELREELNERELKESERVLYVALTRAIESLTLVADNSKKPNKHSWSQKIKWPALGEHQINDANILSVEYNGPLESLNSKIKPLLQLRSVFELIHQDNIKAQSITDIITEKAAASTVDVNPELQFINLKKAQYGTDLHRIFEALKYTDIQKLQKNLSAQDQEAIEYLLS